MPTEKKAPIKKLFSTENLALVVSIIALSVAWLPYHRDLQAPNLLAVGQSSRELTNADEADPPYAKAQLITITVSNRGQKPAHNVRLSVCPILDPDPSVKAYPAKAFTESADSGVLVLTMPVLGIGEHVTLSIHAKYSKEQAMQLSMNTYPCLVYADSDEGVSTSTMIPLVSTIQLMGTSAEGYQITRDSHLSRVLEIGGCPQ